MGSKRIEHNTTPRIAIFIAAAMALLSGCVNKLPPSPVQSICDFAQEGVPDPSSKVRPSSEAAVLLPIRLTDDGEFVSRCELTDALQELRAPGPHLAVIYIHGWKHDARADDTDRIHFKELLEALASAQARAPHPRRVVGVYIAWNGESVAVGGLDNLSFWGRKKASDLITHSAIVTKILGAIDGIERKRRKVDPQLADVTVYIGHSFGARMLYSAVSQVLIHDVELSFPDTMQGYSGASVNPSLPPNVNYSPIPGFGDLVILLNPAFEASFYKSFQTLIRPGGSLDTHGAREGFAPNQLPLMLTLSAKNDLATKIAFPIGQVVGLDPSQIRRTTLGNYKPALTHELTVTSSSATTPTPPSFWYDDFCAETVCLKRKSDIPQTGDPFIVAQAPPEIINGHSGIWATPLRSFLIGFISSVIDHRDAAPQAATP
jgi:hypothetical protein